MPHAGVYYPKLHSCLLDKSYLVIICYLIINQIFELPYQMVSCVDKTMVRVLSIASMDGEKTHGNKKENTHHRSRSKSSKKVPLFLARY